MRNKGIALALAIMLASNVTMAFADPSKSELNDKLNKQKTELQNQKDQLGENKSLLEQAESEIEAIEIEIEKYDFKIEDLNKQIEEAAEKITIATEDIKETEDKVEQAKKDIVDEQDLFDKRIRSMYMDGNISYIEIALNSEDFSDLLSRIEVVKSIMNYDKKILGDLNLKKEDLDNAKKKLEEEKNNLEKLKNEKEENKISLEASKDEQLQLVAKAKEKRDYYASTVSDYADKIAEQQRTIEDTMTLIASIRDQVPEYKPDRGAVDISTNAVVAYATNFLGIPYEWGGNGPNTFDCSGFVRYVFAHFGVSMTRTTYTQYLEGQYVPRDQLRPGDVIFFGSGLPHHVGIYVGNNSYIHAPQTGDVIKISILTRGDYHSARRMF